MHTAEFSFLAPIVTFGFIPIIELFTPQLTSNLTDEARDSKAVPPFFNWLLYLNLPLVYFILGYALITIETSKLTGLQSIAF